MSRAWHCACVQLKSQSEVATAIQLTAEIATKGKLAFISNHTGKEYWSAALARQFLCVSPQEGSWLVFWGATPRFCSLVFEQYNFSGMLIAGEYEVQEQLAQDSYWYYMIWEDGIIQDWFISKPNLYFASWSKGLAHRLLTPYLVKHGVVVNEVSEEYVLNLVRNTNSIFRGDLNILRPFVKTGLNDKSINEWLNLPSAYAVLTNVSDILKLPFVGLNYDIVSMAIYHDVRREVLSLSSRNYPYEDSTVKDAYEWSNSKIHRIDDFQPVLLEWIDGQYLSPLRHEFSDVYYWV